MLCQSYFIYWNFILLVQECTGRAIALTLAVITFAFMVAFASKMLKFFM